MRQLFLLFTLGMLFNLPVLQAQNAKSIFTQEEFLANVSTYHPLAIQAKLVAEIGEAEVQKAKGSFDPVLSSNLYQKYFDEKTYYNLSQHNLRIPTWFGVEANAGFEQNAGAYLDPQNYTTSAGLWYAGIKVPVGQGLFIDKRRAMLKQSKQFRQASLAEQEVMINNLLLNATEAYWNWYLANKELVIAEEGVSLARLRLNATKRGAEVGDRAFIDTLEANIQLQNRILSLSQAQLNVNKSKLELSTFLWSESEVPLELGEDIAPPLTPPSITTALLQQDLELDSLTRSHPMINVEQSQLEILTIESRLKREQLKPRLDISYTPLSQSTASNSLNYSPNNYTWGLNFGIPILLRKERAELKQTNFNIGIAEQNIALQSYQLYNKARSYLIEVNNLESQIVMYQINAESYRKLLEAERQKLSIGESSLFLVNNRESFYLNAQLKLAELQAKQQIALAGYKWSIAKW